MSGPTPLEPIALEPIALEPIAGVAVTTVMDNSCDVLLPD